MTIIGYHASHEQFPPDYLLQCVQKAEEAGFEGAMCSDHFHPWSTQQGESGFAFAWLGAALEATSLPMGVVCAPGYRYHPAIVAQAFATLGKMYPERIWAAFGSGQALNESITGEVWPEKQERNARLRECYEIIDALWEGETVSHHGRVEVVGAHLYTRPEIKPQAMVAAITAETARWAGGFAGGLITIAQSLEDTREVVEAFVEGGGEGKPVFCQVQLSYHQDYEKALSQAHREWKTNIFGSPVLSELPSPDHFEEAARFVTPEEMKEHVLISNQPEQLGEWIRDFGELGFDGLFLHQVGPEQKEFLEIFGAEVLPELKEIL